QIVVGNGADELITLIALAAFDPGDEVAMPHPSFEPYATGAQIAGARVVPSPLAGYETDLDDLRRRVTPRTKVVFLCSPHNPATTIIRRRALALVLEERAYLAAGLERRAIAFAPSQANFMLVRVKDAAAARDRLLRGGILVRDGAAVGFPGHLRITVGTREINERVLKLLED